MQQLVFSIYDTKAAIYSSPWLSPTKGAAIRAFSDNVNDVQSPFYRHPDDYILFQLGVFDDNTGEITMIEPENLGVASTFKTGG